MLNNPGKKALYGDLIDFKVNGGVYNHPEFSVLSDYESVLLSRRAISLKSTCSSSSKSPWLNRSGEVMLAQTLRILLILRPGH